MQTRICTEHFSWLSRTFYDLVRRVDVLVFFSTVNATFAAHSFGTLYKLLCYFASNVSVVTNANVLQMSVTSNS